MRASDLNRWVALACAVLVVGCGSRPDEADSKPDAPPETTDKDAGKKEEPQEPGIQLPKTVNASPGSATRLGPPPKRAKLWTVRWKGARIDFGEGGKFSGSMDKVTGELYDETGKVASTFQGQDGQADKAQDVLRLSGQVKIVSKEHKASLFCDKVEYQPGRNLIRAVGNVRIESESGILNAGQEVLATSDLKRVATPNLF
jgi:hypothetical protein